MEQDPFIYHITHVDNLASIVVEGGLWCDAQRIGRGLACTNIGIRRIKNRRLSRTVPTSSGGCLGDYVPFNFCPRSVMLYVVDKGHDDFGGGQTEIVHLVSRVSTAVGLGRGWAFTDRHAELAHALYFDDLASLAQVPWHVMDETYWSKVREERQAEFLVHDFFPWTAVLGIGVHTPATEAKVQQILQGASHSPAVAVMRKWYY